MKKKKQTKKSPPPAPKPKKRRKRRKTPTFDTISKDAPIPDGPLPEPMTEPHAEGNPAATT